MVCLEAIKVQQPPKGSLHTAEFGAIMIHSYLSLVVFGMLHTQFGGSTMCGLWVCVMHCGILQLFCVLRGAGLGERGQALVLLPVTGPSVRRFT